MCIHTCTVYHYVCFFILVHILLVIHSSTWSIIVTDVNLWLWKQTRTLLHFGGNVTVIHVLKLFIALPPVVLCCTLMLSITIYMPWKCQNTGIITEDYISIISDVVTILLSLWRNPEILPLQCMLKLLFINMHIS